MAKPTPVPPRDRSAIPAGAALGLSVGFLVWAVKFPWSAAAFHYTGEADPGPFVEWSIRAVREWLVAGCVGTFAGAVLGALIGVRFWLYRASVASAGLYLFAARGAWGNLKLPETAPSPLPWAAWLVPTVIVLLASASLGFFYRPWTEKKIGGSSTLVLLGFHVVASCSALHLATQLPYYLSRSSAFFKGFQGFWAWF